jgi:hypothetical protein
LGTGTAAKNGIRKKARMRRLCERHSLKLCCQSKGEKNGKKIHGYRRSVAGVVGRFDGFLRFGTG